MPPHGPFHPEPLVLASYAGRYEFGGDLIDVKKDGDCLAAQWGEKDFTLVPIAPGRFAPEKRLLFGLIHHALTPFEVEFVEIEGHRLAVLKGPSLPRPMVGERVEAAPLSAAWLARLGEFKMAAPADDEAKDFRVTLMKDGGSLVARAPGIHLVLRPVSDEEAVVVGRADEEGATLRVLSEPGGEVLRYSGYRFVAVRKDP